ncbi:transketolase [Marispirochaeta aestuarii]|uniref:transketolase n=1 Tax=Marispirochaeta aestuarii TaxID=1963862 RepID=UPI0029C88D03|nr:transketolase [Marispirochaeta aestuarii]
MNNEKFLKTKAAEIRRSLLDMIYKAKTGHTGGALSSVDILTVLYYGVLRIDSSNPKDPDRDRFVMSKGHSVEGLLTILADNGFFPKEELKQFSKFGSRMIGHPSVKVPGVEFNTGALGHGLSCSVGMALAAQKDKKNINVYCLMGDGEQAEGSVWEAAMAGANFKLNNLTAIIDRNHLQISGKTEDVMRLNSLEEKWRAFGWDVRVQNGHDLHALHETFTGSRTEGKPMLVIAETTKGKGVSFMEDVAKWHHGVPSAEQFEQAMKEIDNYLIQEGLV